MRGVEWAAGIYEGEGNIWILPTRRGCQIQVVNTDVEMLYELQRIFECGKVKPRTNAGSRKQQYVWLVCARADAIRVLEAIRPYLLQRRRADCDEALALLIAASRN